MNKKLITVILSLIVISNSISSNISKDSNSDFGTVDKTLIVTDNSAIIRENASQSSKIITQVRLGTKLSVISQKGNWYRVSYNSDIGYIFKTLVTTQEHFKKISALLKPHHSIPQHARIMFIQPESGAVIREHPSKQAKAIKAFPNGTKLQALKVVDDWYQVKIKSYKGYIHKTVVTSKNEVSQTTSSTQ